MENNKEIEVTIKENEKNERIDKVLLKTIPNISRNHLQKSFDADLVYCFDKKISKSYKPKKDDLIRITIIKNESLNAIPQNIPIDIIYEDKDLLVVNKEKGMVVHPAPGNYENTLVNALLYHSNKNLSSIGGEIRPGIVHRIDKDTSGLLIVAKNDNAHLILAKQIENHSFERIYEAVVSGVVKEDEKVINLPIGRSEKDRKKMDVTYKNSKEAITEFRVIERFKKYTHLRLKLKTGRTHQIRVHMAHIGHPLAGDSVYSKRDKLKFLNGQCLHAKTIEFEHPTTKKILKFTSDLPPYFRNFLNNLEK